MDAQEASGAPAGGTESAHGVTREEAIRRGLRAVVRLGHADYFHGPAECPPEGAFIAYVRPEAVVAVCEQLRQDDLHRPGPHPGHAPSHALRGSDGRFRCGHAKIPENSYTARGSVSCRECSLRRSSEWNRRHRDRQRESARRYYTAHRDEIALRRQQHLLAFQLYFHLRRLMIRDGAWPSREERGEPERSEA